MVPYFCIWMSVAIIEKFDDFVFCDLCGFLLFGRENIDGHDQGWINGPGIIQ
jgi:hypothetical protein